MRKNEAIVGKIKNEIKKMFRDENSGHDVKHLFIVLKNAKKIQKTEGGDIFVIELSALLHDVHRIMQNESGKYVSPEESLSKVKEILQKCKVDAETTLKVLEVVKEHDNKQNKNVNHETLVIQDADALESLGTRGLKRTLKYCKTHNIPMVDKNFDLDCKEYVPDVNPISALHYVYRTLVPIKNVLTFDISKKIAKNKSRVFERFVKKTSRKYGI